MRFLADESRDLRVVVALREAGHDVASVAETAPGAPDAEVLSWARRDRRICLAEDRDFGWLVLAGGEEAGSGVFFIGCPESARESLPARIVAEIERLGAEVNGAFVVWTAERTRVVRVRPPSASEAAEE